MTIPAPYKHQERVSDLIATSVNELYLNHSLGSGKTRTVIESLRKIFNKEKTIKKVLILCPASVPFNWRNEILKFSQIPDDRIFVIPATKRKEKLQQAIEDGKKILILNYEALLAQEIKKMIMQWQPQILVMDEIHKLKTPTSIRTKTVAEIAMKTEKRIGLSGTPILKNLMDVYSQFKCLDKGATFGTNFFTFRNRYFVDMNAAWAKSQKHFPKWIVRKEAQEQLMNLIAKKTDVVTSDECLSLPPRIEMTEYVELSPEQAKSYKMMKDAFITFVEDNAENPSIATVAPVKALRLNQICAGHLTLESGEQYQFKNNPKLERLFEILEEVIDEHKVIVWTSFRQDVKMISERAKEVGYKFVTITGDQNAQEKQESIDAFEKDPSVRLVVANRAAGGTGTTLVQASYDISYSMNYNLGDYLQAAARNMRAGSEIHERITSIFLCTRGTIEEIIKKALDNKTEIGQTVLAWAKNAQKNK